MEGTNEGAARIASWFRELVPPRHAMWFLDLGNTAQVDAVPGMTADALAAAYIEAVNR